MRRRWLPKEVGKSFREGRRRLCKSPEAEINIVYSRNAKKARWLEGKAGEGDEEEPNEVEGAMGNHTMTYYKAI